MKRTVSVLSVVTLAFLVTTARGEAGRTVLGVTNGQFAVNGKPTFLLGFSYFAALGAPEDFIRADLKEFQSRGFNWLRVWATWAAFGNDVSAVDTAGKAREPFMARLKWLVEECDRRGVIVDITLTRGQGPGHLPSMAAHQQAEVTLLKELAAQRNWYLDLANEHDVRDDRYVPTADLKVLREEARRLAPGRLVTASCGGHDLTAEDIRDLVLGAGLDFLCPHRPRNSGSAEETEQATLSIVRLLQKEGRVVPIHYQEPFRRGYGRWQPVSDDFLKDLEGALAGGAAGWCFHNGSKSDAVNGQPRRSFDLHDAPLFKQLEPDELIFVNSAAKSALKSTRSGTPNRR